jgi:murein L,D-transpeptidase YcbB/YkuD
MLVMLIGTAASLCGHAQAQTPEARALLLAERQRLSQEQAVQPQLAPGPLLRPGDTGPTVPLLRAALAALGWAAAADPGADTVYDARLVATVRLFQAAQGLVPDGIVGPDTRDAINNAAARRIARIDQALALPDWPAAGRAIVVNIAAAEVVALEDGRPILVSNAVIGRNASGQRTPVLTTAIRSVTINPSWTVPPGIAARKFGGDRFTLPPGPANPLGRIRLDMPNDYLVYLHDTNEPALFAEPVRTFSSGCVRVERIREIARWLLGDEAWAAQDIETLLESRRTLVVPLPEPVPVILEYRLASVGPEGSIRYHLDPYWRANTQIAAGPEFWQVAP